MSILLISPYPELSTLAQKVAQELNYQLFVETTVLDKGVDKAKEYVSHKNVEVIISRGPTGSLIKKSVSLPTIFIEVSAFDVFSALYEAQKVGRKIAFFDYRYNQDKYDLNLMKEILSLDKLSVYYYSNGEELNQNVNEASREGNDVVVASGICIIQQAHQKGMQGVMIKSRREAVIEALERATDIINIGKQYREANERIKTVMDNICDGVVVLDTHHNITHFNPVAENVLGVKANKAIGHHISNFKKAKPLEPILEEKDFLTNKILNLGNQQYLINKIPIKNNKEHFGTAVTFQPIANIQKIEAKIRKELYAKGHLAKYRFNDIIGESQPLQNAVNKAQKFSKTDSTILITGESGTGKELFAQSIHNAGQRNQYPFIAINCATLPESLLESELFGYEEGAFTGAKKGGKAGIFELSHQGTIFLDEIGELPLKLQARLLRVIEEKAVRRVGGERIIPVDVRIIAATNRDLEKTVQSGDFREDLFFRLNVLDLKVPPLRERKEDIYPLIEHFINKYENKCGKKVPALPDYSVKFLLNYHWPGNTRELENFIEKYVTLLDNPSEQVTLLEELARDIYQKQSASNESNNSSLQNTIEIPLGSLKEMEMAIIKKLADSYELDKETLAQKLGISRTTLWKKLKILRN